MADRVEVYVVTVPPGTSQAAPAVTNLPYTDGLLVRWEVVIPDGVAALAGFRFAYGGQPVIPDTVGGWFTGNGEKLGDDVNYAFTGGRWQLVGYNLGAYQHSFYVRLYVNEISHVPGASQPIGTVSLLDLNGGTVDLTAPPDLTAPAVDLGDLGQVGGGDVPAGLGLGETGTTTPVDSAAPSVDIATDVADTGTVTDTTAPADLAAADDTATVAAPTLDDGSDL